MHICIHTFFDLFLLERFYLLVSFIDFVALLINAFIGWLLDVSWLGIVPTTLVFWDDTNQLTYLVRAFPFSFLNMISFDPSKNFGLALLCFGVLLLVDFSYLQAYDLSHFDSSDAPNGCASETQPSVHGC